MGVHTMFECWCNVRGLMQCLNFDAMFGGVDAILGCWSNAPLLMLLSCWCNIRVLMQCLGVYVLHEILKLSYSRHLLTQLAHTIVIPDSTHFCNFYSVCTLIWMCWMCCDSIIATEIPQKSKREHPESYLQIPIFSWETLWLNNCIDFSPVLCQE